MKKFINIVLLGFVILCGCAKIEDVTSVKNSGAEIVFSTGGSRTQTKAIVSGTTMVDNFGVYGYVVPGDYTTDDSVYLMKNAEYEEDGTAANGAHYYWPKSDNNTNVEILFTAYSQFVDAPGYDSASGDITITVPTLTQELIADPSDFDDILWAQAKPNHQDALADHYRVPLVFRHALAWIGFRAEVADNSSIKYVDIKSVKFTAASEGTPAIPAQPAVYDTTDTWVNLKRSYSAVGSATKLKGPGETSYTNAAALPEELVAEIKSYYTIDNGTAGEYDLHMGNSVWPSATIKQLRVVKDIPAAYDLAVEMTGGEVMHFFNGWKYLQDNGYDIQPASSGGKPDVWNYVLIDCFVNGSAYTVVGLNCWDGNAAPQHTVEEISPAVPEVPAVPGVPGAVADGLYTDGTLVIPTRSLVTTTLSATYTGEKNTTFEFAPNNTRLWGTSYDGDHNAVLSDVLVIPQDVPVYVTLVYDICIKNETGDDVLLKGRTIVRQINYGTDSDDAHAYVSTWNSSNKYIYNFKINVEDIDFSVAVNSWDVNSSDYHIWDYSN